MDSSRPPSVDRAAPRPAASRVGPILTLIAIGLVWALFAFVFAGFLTAIKWQFAELKHYLLVVFLLGLLIWIPWQAVTCWKQSSRSNR